MRDPEFIVLRNRFLIGLVIFIVFITLIIMVFNRFYGHYSGEVYDMISDNKTLVFLQTSNDCELCDSVKDILDKNNINYEEVTMSLKDRHEDIYRLLDIDSKKITPPSLFYIKNGDVVSYLNNISSENEVNDFIKNYLGG